MSGKLRNMTSIYLRRGNKFLLLYRVGSRVIGNSYTGTAGGHMEELELNNPRACVLRELEEETGLTEHDIHYFAFKEWRGAPELLFFWRTGRSCGCRNAYQQ